MPAPMKRLPIKDLLLVLAGLTVGFTLALGGAVLAELDAPPEPATGIPDDDSRLLAEVLKRVQHEYVEPVSGHQLMNNAVRGMVSELDAHSQYLSREEFEEIRISTNGAYSGVGIEVQMVDGQVVVVAPIEGSPAERAGIRPGDVILRIDGEPVVPRNVTDTVVRMRGADGTPVHLTVAREGQPGPLVFDLTRSNVEVHSVSAAMPEPGFGYLRISQFSDTTARDVRHAVGGLRRQAGGELQGLIIDLRGNPGGVLEAAVDVADAFLEEGLIVTASGRTRDATFQRQALPGDLLDGAPVVVIVNGGSASASEIVAGALKDHGRATIIGTRTFGKGSVQTVMPLSEGRAVKLTTSRYFTPDGQSIQGTGITPDVELPAAMATTGAPAGAGPAPQVRHRLADDPAVSRALQVLRARPTLQASIG